MNPPDENSQDKEDENRKSDREPACDLPEHQISRTWNKPVHNGDHGRGDIERTTLGHIRRVTVAYGEGMTSFPVPSAPVLRGEG